MPEPAPQDAGPRVADSPPLAGPPAGPSGAPSAGSPGLRVWLALAAIILLTWIGRLHTYSQPLDRDLTTYAVIGREMLAGKRLYTDIWDNKPPVVYLLFAGAQAAAGPGPGAIYLMNVVAVGLTILLIHLAVLRAGMGAAAGLAAAGLYALLSFDVGLQANQPNLESWINPSLLGILALLLSHRSRPMPIRAAIAIGLLAAFASLLKHVVVFPVVAGTGLYVLLACTWRDRLRRLGLMTLAAAVVVAAWGVCAGYFAARGRWGDFYNAVFYFNATFVEGNLILPRIWGNVGYFTQLFAPAVLPGFLLAGVAWRTRDPRGLAPHLLLAAMALGALAAALAPGKFYPHYFQLLFPAYAVSLGLAIGLGRQVIPPTSRGMRALGGVAVAGLLLWKCFVVGESLTHTPEEWSVRGFGTDFVMTWREGARVRAALKPDETFYDLGAETGLYYFTGQSPPTTVFFYLPVFQGPLAPRYSRLTLEQLQARPPALITLMERRVGDLSAASGAHPLLTWVQANYWRLPENSPTGFRWFIRRGSDLERRLLERVQGAGSRPTASAPAQK